MSSSSRDITKPIFPPTSTSPPPFFSILPSSILPFRTTSSPSAPLRATNPSSPPCLKPSCPQDGVASSSCVVSNPPPRRLGRLAALSATLDGWLLRSKRRRFQRRHGSLLLTIVPLLLGILSDLFARQKTNRNGKEQVEIWIK